MIKNKLTKSLLLIKILPIVFLVIPIFLLGQLYSFINIYLAYLIYIVYVLLNIVLVVKRNRNIFLITNITDICIIFICLLYMVSIIKSMLHAPGEAAFGLIIGTIPISVFVYGIVNIIINNKLMKR